MPDSVSKAVQQAIDSGLLPYIGGAILTIVGAVYVLYKTIYQFVFKRQIERLDANVKLAEANKNELGILKMQMELTLESIKEEKQIHKETMIAVYETIKAVDLRAEKSLAVLSDHLKTLVQLASNRRASDPVNEDTQSP